MIKTVYPGLEMEINMFVSEDVIVASGTDDFVPDVSTGPNDLPIMPG